LTVGTRIFTGIADEAVTPTTLPKMLAVRTMIDKEPQETDAHHIGRLKEELGAYLKLAEARVVKEEAFEKQQAMANNMAFAIH